MVRFKQIRRIYDFYVYSPYLRKSNNFPSISAVYLPSLVKLSEIRCKCGVHTAYLRRIRQRIRVVQYVIWARKFLENDTIKADAAKIRKNRIFAVFALIVSFSQYFRRISATYLCGAVRHLSPKFWLVLAIYNRNQGKFWKKFFRKKDTKYQWLRNLPTEISGEA